MTAPSTVPAAGSQRDVVVIGAGPAGCATAIALRGLGVDVLVLERKRMPRWKVCGCCLEGVAVRALERLGVADRLAGRWLPLREIRIAGWGREARIAAAGRALSRERLDLALAEAAREAGAEVCWPVRAGIGPSGVHSRSVLLRTPDGERTVHARVVVGAWGLAGPAVAGSPGEAAGSGGRVGVGGTIPGDRLELPDGQVCLLVGDDGYMGLVRREDGDVNVAASLRSGTVAAAGEIGAILGGLLAGTGLDRETLDGVDWRGTPSLRRLHPRGGDRLVTVGDAAGFWEPFTGEGIAWALDAGLHMAPDLVPLIERWSDAGARRLASRLRRRMLLRQSRSRAVAAIAGTPAVARRVLGAISVLPGLARPLRPAAAAASPRETA